MTEHFMPHLSCEHVRDAAAELALGVLPAQERAEVIWHLDDCPDCRAHLRGYTQVADGLLDLVPAVQPPAGFEERMLGRLGLGAGPGAGRTGNGPATTGSIPVVPLPSRRELRHQTAGERRMGTRLRSVLAAAAAVIAVAAGTGGYLAGQQRSASDSHLYEAVLMTSDHREVGEVYAVTGEHGWVSMEIDTGGASETVKCKVVREDGSTVPLGEFWLKDGKGWWGAPVEPGATPVTAQLVREDGTVLASGNFPVG